MLSQRTTQLLGAILHPMVRGRTKMDSLRRQHMRKQLNTPLLIALFAMLVSTPATVWAQHPVTGRAQDRIEREVRHELIMLPYYGVFDNLGYEVDGYTVTLTGQVTRPTLKSDAESVVRKIEGVERVNNQIEVLPVSPNDDRIRLAEYRSVYGQGGLERYGLLHIQSVHIIVKNGHVTLEGTVANEGDKNIANIRAHGVPGVFSVTNHLRLEKS
jgi:osmotically-inducible protein OsmY